MCELFPWHILEVDRHAYGSGTAACFRLLNIHFVLFSMHFVFFALSEHLQVSPRVWVYPVVS